MIVVSHNTIRKINRAYSDLLADAKSRVGGERVQYQGRKGIVAAVHLNSQLMTIDINFNDGSSPAKGIDPLTVEFDPM